MSKKREKSPKPNFNLDEVLANLPKNLGGNDSENPKAVNQNLQNYIEVPKNKIASLPVGAYLRFVDLNGNVKPGGGKVKSVKDHVITLGNFNFGTKKYFIWKVNTKEVSKIYQYIKPTDGDNSAEPKSTESRPSVKGGQSQAQSQTQEPHQFQVQEPQSEEDQVMSELGSKLLFNDNEILRQKVDGLEAEMKRIDADLKKIVILLKRLYQEKA